MTLIEVVLLILSVCLGLCLIYFKQLSRLAKHFLTVNQHKLTNLNLVFKSIYQVLRKLRRFSAVYVLKNYYYRVYLAIAIAIILTKIGFHYQPQTAQYSPVWVHKVTDFLIISAVWELICLATKIIEQKFDQKL